MSDNNDLAKSIIRTLAPTLAALIIGLPIMPAIFDWLGWTSAQGQANVTAAVIFVLSAVWYVVARVLEHNHPTAGGRMLIVPSSPTYKSEEPGCPGGPSCPGRVAELADTPRH